MTPCCTKPAFVKRAFLICAHIESADHLISGSVDSYPSLDEMVASGVSTGVMLPRSGLKLQVTPLVALVMKFVQEIAPEYREWTEVLSGLENQAMMERVRAIWEGRSRRLVVINVGSNLNDANIVAEQLLLLAKAACHPENTTGAAEELVGTLVCGAENWNLLFGEAQRAEPLPRGFPMPRQSWTFARHTEDFEDYTAGGFACWNGRGLERIDARESMGQVGVRPGEGFLRLDQIVNELMSKIGAIPKFGA